MTTDLQDILSLPLDDVPPNSSVARLEATNGGLAIPTCPFLTIADTASWLGVSVSTVNRLMTRGELIAVRIGARRKIPNTSLAAYITRDAVNTIMNRPI